MISMAPKIPRIHVRVSEQSPQAKTTSIRDQRNAIGQFATPGHIARWALGFDAQLLDNGADALVRWAQSRLPLEAGEDRFTAPVRRPPKPAEVERHEQRLAEIAALAGKLIEAIPEWVPRRFLGLHHQRRLDLELDHATHPLREPITTALPVHHAAFWLRAHGHPEVAVPPCPPELAPDHSRTMQV